MTEVEFFLPIHIPELKGLYEVGSFGNIKKLSRRSASIYKKCPNTKEIILKNNTSGDYPRVKMGVYKGKGRWYYVHRLVAAVFLEAVPGKEHVNHKDANKRNNHYKNLQWCTPKENNDHWYNIWVKRNGRKVKPPLKKKWEKKTKGGFCKPIIDLNTGIFWTSKELATLFGKNPKYINRMLNEERKPNTTQYRYA